MKNKLFFAILLMVISVSMNAQSLDSSFGTNGTVTLDLGDYFEATELPDGNVILSGDYDNGSVSKAVIAKIKPDGSLDTSFGTGGKYTIDQFSDYDYYESFSKVSALSDGKLLFLYGAYYDNGIDEETLNFKMIRLNANGTVDNTFSGVSSNNVSEDDEPYGLVVLPTGKILMYGADYMMRFNANGTLDTGYANNGTRTISFEIDDLYMIGNAIYLYDYAGKRLVKLNDESATSTQTYSLPQNYGFDFNGNNIYIQDYTNPNSTTLKKLDASFNPVNNFGIGGTATFSEYLGYDFIFQPQGSIITYTNQYVYDNNGNHISTDKEYRRINPNGQLDSTFGTAGVYKINIPESAPYNYWSDDRLHSNGKLYHQFSDKNNEISNASIYLKRSNLPNENLATNDAVLASDVRIIQNPVKESLQLTGNLINAKIYDISGKETGITFGGKQISVESLKPGVYIINAASESGSKVNLKFIKK